MFRSWRSSKQDPRRRTGRSAERWVAFHYWVRGYRVLARNERFGGVEVDLVAWRDGTIVIVEVKSRRQPGNRTPRRRAGDAWRTRAVGPDQRARLLRVAAGFAGRRGILAVRIDLAFVEWRSARFRPPRIRVQESAIGVESSL